MRRLLPAFLALLVASLLGPGARVALADPVEDDAALRPTLLAAALRSNDLRVRIAWSLDGVEQRANGNWYSIETIPIAALVDLVRGSTDPVVLEMMIPRCAASYQPRDVCDPMAFALRWTAVDAQNQRAWLAVTSLLRERGEVEAARAMFRRAAEASASRESASELARSLAAGLPAGMSDPQRLDALSVTNGKAIAAVTFTTLSVVNASCRDIELRKPCERIVETMARDAESLIVMRMAAAMAERTALPDTTKQAIRQRSDAMAWAASHLARDEPADDAGGDHRKLAVVSALTSGERRSLERVMQQAGIDEREAARRYVASLTPAEVAGRKAMADPPYATVAR